jgi:hypothetical protein
VLIIVEALAPAVVGKVQCSAAADRAAASSETVKETVVGLAGAGRTVKTVYLASMFHQLKVPDASGVVLSTTS